MLYYNSLKRGLFLDYLNIWPFDTDWPSKSEIWIHCYNYITKDNPIWKPYFINIWCNLKETFREQNYNKDSKWLDPTTLFSGLDKRLSNIVYYCLRFVFILFVLFSMICWMQMYFVLCSWNYQCIGFFRT